MFDTCNYKQQAICIISTMHLLFSNFKKQANSLPLGNFSCAVVSTTICMYLYLHIPHWPNFPQTKTFITFDRYWSLACYHSIFKVHSKCIYAIILHTTQALNNTSGHLQTKYWQKKDLKIHSSLNSFPKKSNFWHGQLAEYKNFMYF